MEQLDTMIVVHLLSVRFVGRRTQFILGSKFGLYLLRPRMIAIRRPESDVMLTLPGQRLRLYSGTHWQHWHMFRPHVVQIEGSTIDGVSEEWLIDFFKQKIKVKAMSNDYADTSENLYRLK